MRWSAAVLTATVVAAALWMSLGGPNAEQIFAQAIDRVAKAKTLSAVETASYTVEGRRESFEQRIMFKQPYLERRENVKNGQVEEVSITDYGRRRRLMLQPGNKEARYSDWTNVFEVDPKTGNAKPEKLNMSFRDELLSLQSRAVEDLGEVDLSRQKVRLTQSSNGKLVVKAWTDPHTGRPVQVLIARPNEEDIVSSIKIDEPLADDLFNLEPPPGYKVVSNAMPNARVGQALCEGEVLDSPMLAIRVKASQDLSGKTLRSRPEAGSSSEPAENFRRRPVRLCPTRVQWRHFQKSGAVRTLQGLA